MSALFASYLPVALINDSNIQICWDPHPLSLAIPEPNDCPRSTRLSAKNTKREKLITPNEILIIVSQLHRAKAAGNELDSIDFFVNLAASHARARLKKSKTFVKPEILVVFFVQSIPGDLLTKIASIFRTTHLVALQKCEVDPTWLRPLGIPSALRQIAAKVILHLFRTRFAKRLLPFNYGFGMNGGMDFSISMVHLGHGRAALQFWLYCR